MSKPYYSIDAPDQQRLKIARVKIEAVLKEHDLAGVVVLHTPVKSKLADYPNRAQQLHDQAATANMARALATDLGDGARMFSLVASFVDFAAKAEHTKRSFVADPLESKRQ